MNHAIVREISASIGNCEISFVSRDPIDIDLARQQHAAYQRLLAELGCQLTVLPAEDAMPDAVFVEDVALVLDMQGLMAAALQAQQPVRHAQTTPRFAPSE